MGCDPNWNPPPRWFCGRTYLAIAKDILEQMKGRDLGSLEDIVALIEARINIFRGLRAAVMLPPDKSQDYTEMVDALSGHISDAHFSRLKEILKRKDVRVVGTGQYGVPNFDLWSLQSPTRKLSLPGDCGDPELLTIACQERVAEIEALLQLAQDALCAIFISDNEKEFDLGSLEYVEDADIHRALIKGGFADSVEMAERVYQEADRQPDGEIAKFLYSWARANQVDTFREMHAGMFWAYKETDSIYHRFSD